MMDQKRKLSWRNAILSLLVVQLAQHGVSKNNNSLAFALAASAATTPKLELKYFDIRGVAETARLILAAGGEPYTDTRFGITPGTMEAPEFKLAKEAGDLKANLNRAPVLILTEGEHVTEIGQSKTIERFLAKRLGLMGSNNLEEAQIDCIAEHSRDVKDAAMRKAFSRFVKDKTDEEKAALRKEWFETDMPSLLERLNACITESSTCKEYAVGSSLSYADIVLFSLLCDIPEADSADTAKAFETCDALQAIVQNVKSNGNIAKWLSERPESLF
jgi:glutathione S-transferase